VEGIGRMEESMTSRPMVDGSVSSILYLSMHYRRQVDDGRGASVRYIFVQTDCRQVIIRQKTNFCLFLVECAVDDRKHGKERDAQLSHNIGQQN